MRSGKKRNAGWAGMLILVLVLLVSTVSVKREHAKAEGVPLKTGNYYYSLAPNAGAKPDNGASGLVSSENGAIMDGLTTTYAGWTGSATSVGTVQVVIDLLKDYPIDAINVVVNAPNSYWGFKEMTVKYRSEAMTDYYYIAGKYVATGTSLNTTVNLPMGNKTARFIVIDMKRVHAYQNLPLTDVQIYKGTGDEGTEASPAYSAEQMQAELKKDAMMADKYGQWIYETWDGKVTSDKQMRQEYAAEAGALKNVKLDRLKYDQYGGIKNGGHYKETGYFRLQQVDGKWWFITPAGYEFFLKGVDAASIWEWGYGTPYHKADGTPRQVFEALPDPVAFAPAYASDINGERVSFLVANIMKKYGGNYEAKWENITKKRLIDWGFNAFSKWSKPRFIHDFPYMELLQDPTTLKRIQWTYDVFDPQTPSIIEESLKPRLKELKYDRWLIGYTYDNEAGWNTDIVKTVLTYGSDSAAKKAFVDLVAAKYNGDIAAVNAILGTSAASFEDLYAASINFDSVPAEVVSAYIQLASNTYFSTVKSIIKKYDPNHLFLGSTIVPTWRTSLDWDSAAMGIVDAFSVDNYSNDPTWIARYASFNKPLLNMEFTFSTSQHGLSPVNGATSVPGTMERGAAFEAFVESQAANPLFVGSGWFSYYDQAVTGRRDNENFNLGLVNQQDQPYKDMVQIMKTVNAGLETIHRNGG